MAGELTIVPKASGIVAHPLFTGIAKSALVPVYENQSREALLSEVRLPCTGTEAVWLQAGCALFLSVDA